MSGHHQQANLQPRDTADLPLTFVGIALFSSKEAHRLVIGMRDEGVTRITRRAANAQRHALMDTLRRAQMEGELDAQMNIESLADFFEATLAGIRIAAKAGKTRPALRRIAEVASGTFADVKSSVL